MAAGGESIFLNDEEKSWLEVHASQIRVAPEKNYPPFSFVEGASWQGISAEMVQLLQNRLDVKFQLLPAKNLDAILGGVRLSEVDVVTSIKATPERAEYLAFTPPYIKVPTAIIVRTQRTEGRWPDDFVGKKVAVGKGYGVQGYLEKKFPSVTLWPVPDDLDGLRKLSFGEVDAVIMDVASASFFIEREKITNLRVFSSFEYTYDLSFGVRKDLPVLHDILSKTLATIPDRDKQAVVERWISLRLDARTAALARLQPWLLPTVGILAALLVTGALVWRIRRQHQGVAPTNSDYARSLLEASLDRETIKRLDEVRIKRESLKTLLSKRIGALTLVLFIALSAIVGTGVSDAAFESPRLLAILNTLFLCLIPLTLANVAANSHRVTAMAGFLMLGCGLVVFGFGSLYAGWIMPLSGTPNPTVTVHNLGSLIAGLCELMGAQFFLTELTGGPSIRTRIKRPSVLYGGGVVLITVIALLAFYGVLPVFFDRVNGPTPLRQLVLGASAFLFSMAGLLFIQIYLTQKTDFSYWYGLGLWLITVGLVGVMEQPSVGSMLGWVGRSAQYAGCVFLLVALLRGRRERDRGTSNSAAQETSTLWPFLEQVIEERVGDLKRLNEALQREIAERKAAEESVRRASQYARSLLEASLDPLVTISAEGKVTDVNTATEQVTGVARSELVGSDFADYFTEPEKAREGYQQVFARGFVTDYPLAIRHTSGKITDVLYNASIYRNEGGKVLGVFAAARDVTERKKAESYMQAASVFTHAREGIMITGADATILNINNAFTRITGYSREEAIGTNPRILKSDRQGKDFYVAMWGDLLDKGHWYGEIWNQRKNGEDYAAALTITAVYGSNGEIEQFVALFSDITALKQHQDEMEHMAHFDALTNLPNRLLLSDRIQQGLAQADRRGLTMAIVYLDLDGFKAINDQHGHEAGDQLLIALAARMKQALREGDTLARLGGDEFVAVLIDLSDTNAATPLLARLLEAASQPVQLGKVLLRVSASLGVTFYPQQQSMDADQLLRQADQAMYQAKVSGKNRFHIFDAKKDSSLRVHHEGLERIRLALDQHEFVLHYQPKVNMRTGAVMGAEALIRWQHPERGLLAPALFLPVIEDHPLAVDMGEWVMNTALAQIQEWQAMGLELPVSVNVGARQLQQSDFVDRLRAILAEYPAVNPAQLELEILETSALEDVTQVSRLIEACCELGVLFALDDFGTGYSSLTYLKRLRVNMLKIDQSFVRDMLDDPDDLAILEGVIGLAAAFKRQVIAEGVETVAHGTALLHLGCELAQGYGIARPMPAQQMPAWVATWQPDAAWCELPSFGGASDSRYE